MSLRFCSLSKAIANTDQTTANNLDARSVEALQAISGGFADLGASDPELVYKVFLDLLGSLNQYVSPIHRPDVSLNFP